MATVEETKDVFLHTEDSVLPSSDDVTIQPEDSVLSSSDGITIQPENSVLPSSDDVTIQPEDSVLSSSDSITIQPEDGVLPSSDDVTIQLTVLNPQCAVQMESVGVSVMYYCVQCGHHSDRLSAVTQHVAAGCQGTTVSLQHITQAAQLIAQQKWLQKDKTSLAFHHEPQDLDPDPHQDLQQNFCKGEDTDSQVGDCAIEQVQELNLNLETLRGKNAVESDPRQWSCQLCPYTPLYSQTDADEHHKCHDPSGVEGLACHVCAKGCGPSTKDWHRLRSHLSLIHKVDFQLKCKNCGATFKEHAGYNKHINTHKHGCSWDFCRFSSYSKADMSTHEKCHTGPDGRKFSCYLCRYQNKREPGKWGIMHAHLVSRHKGAIQGRYTCSVCRKGFQELRKYQQHIPCRQSRKTWYCETCRKAVRSRQALKIHQAEHGKGHIVRAVKEEPERQPQCGNTAAPVRVSHQSETVRDPTTIMLGPADDAQLIIVSTVLDDISETLPPQTVQTTTADTLSGSALPPQTVQTPNTDTLSGSTLPPQTVQTPTADSPSEQDPSQVMFRCCYCYKKFATDARCQRHLLRQHSAKRMQRVKCSMCDRDFRNKMQWTNHRREVHEGKRRHRGDKANPSRTQKFVCETCGYTTPEAARLRNHKLSAHQGVLPYKCSHCQYRTNEKSDLYRHQWKHRPIKRYHCGQCSYATNARWVLVNHCLKQHSVELPRLHRNTLGGQGSKHWSRQGLVSSHSHQHILQAIGDQNSVVHTPAQCDGVQTHPAADLNNAEILAKASEQPNANQNTPATLQTTPTETVQVVYIQTDDTNSPVTVTCHSSMGD